MKNITLFLIVFSFVSCVNNTDKSKNDKVEKESIIEFAKVEKLAGDFLFTEGPATDKEGNVYFTDIPQNLILIWTVDNKLDTFRVNSGGANGLYFDKYENLLACEGGNGQVSQTTIKGEYSPIATKYEGSMFNQPNDLWPDGRGGFYFTDPKYGEDETNLPQDGMHVYYVTPGNNEIIKVCDDYEKPNGIIGTPDGSTLYVTDNTGGKTYSYNILEDGTLSNKSLFADIGSDGMTIDMAGNVYLTPSGKRAVDIYSPGGKLISSIPVPEEPSNVCFGGKDRNQLFITARTSIYRAELNTYGVD